MPRRSAASPERTSLPGTRLQNNYLAVSEGGGVAGFSSRGVNGSKHGGNVSLYARTSISGLPGNSQAPESLTSPNARPRFGGSARPVSAMPAAVTPQRRAARPASALIPTRPMTPPQTSLDGSGMLKGVCRHVHAESMVLHRDKESLAEEWHQLMCSFDPAHPEYVTTPIAREVDSYTLAYAIMLIREGNFNPENPNAGGCSHCSLSSAVDHDTLNALLDRAVRCIRQEGRKRPVSATPDFMRMTEDDRVALLKRIYGSRNVPRKPRLRLYNLPEYPLAEDTGAAGANSQRSAAGSLPHSSNSGTPSAIPAQPAASKPASARPMVASMAVSDRSSASSGGAPEVISAIEFDDTDDIPNDDGGASEPEDDTPQQRQRQPAPPPPPPPPLATPEPRRSAQLRAQGTQTDHSTAADAAAMPREQSGTQSENSSPTKQVAESTGGASLPNEQAGGLNRRVGSDTGQDAGVQTDGAGALAAPVTVDGETQVEPSAGQDGDTQWDARDFTPAETQGQVLARLGFAGADPIGVAAFATAATRALEAMSQLSAGMTTSGGEGDVHEAALARAAATAQPAGDPACVSASNCACSSSSMDLPGSGKGLHLGAADAVNSSKSGHGVSEGQSLEAAAAADNASCSGPVTAMRGHEADSTAQHTAPRNTASHGLDAAHHGDSVSRGAAEASEQLPALAGLQRMLEQTHEQLDSQMEGAVLADGDAPADVSERPAFTTSPHSRSKLAEVATESALDTAPRFEIADYEVRDWAVGGAGSDVARVLRGKATKRNADILEGKHMGRMMGLESVKFVAGYDNVTSGARFGARSPSKGLRSPLKGQRSPGKLQRRAAPNKQTADSWVGEVAEHLYSRDGSTPLASTPQQLAQVLVTLADAQRRAQALSTGMGQRTVGQGAKAAPALLLPSLVNDPLADAGLPSLGPLLQQLQLAGSQFVCCLISAASVCLGPSAAAQPGLLDSCTPNLTSVPDNILTPRPGPAAEEDVDQALVDTVAAAAGLQRLLRVLADKLHMARQILSHRPCPATTSAALQLVCDLATAAQRTYAGLQAFAAPALQCLQTLHQAWRPEGGSASQPQQRQSEAAMDLLRQLFGQVHTFSQTLVSVLGDTCAVRDKGAKLLCVTEVFSGSTFETVLAMVARLQELAQAVDRLYGARPSRVLIATLDAGLASVDAAAGKEALTHKDIQADSSTGQQEETAQVQASRQHRASDSQVTDWQSPTGMSAAGLRDNTSRSSNTAGGPSALCESVEAADDEVAEVQQQEQEQAQQRLLVSTASRADRPPVARRAESRKDREPNEQQGQPPLQQQGHQLARTSSRSERLARGISEGPEPLPRRRAASRADSKTERLKKEAEAVIAEVFEGVAVNLTDSIAQAVAHAVAGAVDYDILPEETRRRLKAQASGFLTSTAGEASHSDTGLFDTALEQPAAACGSGKRMLHAAVLLPVLQGCLLNARALLDSWLYTCQQAWNIIRANALHEGCQSVEMPAYQELMRQLEQARQQLQQQDQLLIQARANAGDSNGQLRQAALELGGTKGELEEAKRNLGESCTQPEVAKDEPSVADEQVEGLREQLAEALAKCAEVEAVLKGHEDEVKASRSTRDQNNREWDMDRQSESNEVKSTRIRELDSSLASCNSCPQLQEKLGSKERQLAGLQEQLQAAESRRQVLQEKVKDLTAALEAARLRPEPQKAGQKGWCH